MFGTPTLPAAVIYLLLLLFEGLGLEPPLELHYLQDGSPAYTLTVEVDDALVADDLFTITAVPIAEPAVARDADVDDRQAQPEPAPELVRVEESELAGHTYLVHEPGGGAPWIVELAPVLGQLTGVATPVVRTIVLDRDAAGPTSDVDGSPRAPSTGFGPGGSVHVVRRGTSLLLTHPSSGITLFVTEE